MTSRRLEPLPGRPGRPRTVTFTFDGRRMTGVAGEPIASALHAGGVTVLSRSFKYHRPRGLHCMAGSCPSCAMRVDGVPGVATCETPLRGGETIMRERGWPSADRDVLRLLDVTSRLTPNGFQYRRLRRHQRLFELVEPVLKRLAARGDLPEPVAAARLITRHSRELAVDVGVIGGGLAGMRAALAAAAGGAGSVALVERRAQLGGVARLDRTRWPELDGLTRRIGRQSRIVLLSPATAFAWYESDRVLVASGHGLVHLRASRWVVATGAHPQPCAFPGNDLPGVMLGDAVRRLLLDDVRPGDRVLIASGTDDGDSLAMELRARGVTVVGVVPAADVERAHGRRRLGAVTVNGVRFACDVLCVDVARRPADELVRQLLSDGGIVIEDRSAASVGAIRDGSVEVARGVWLAGDVLGVSSARGAAVQGEAAGIAAVAGNSVARRPTEECCR